jgi:hypothetical protein
MSKSKFGGKTGSSGLDAADVGTTGASDKVLKGLQKDFNKAYKDWEKRRKIKPLKMK